MNVHRLCDFEYRYLGINCICLHLCTGCIFRKCTWKLRQWLCLTNHRPRYMTTPCCQPGRLQTAVKQLAMLFCFGGVCGIFKWMITSQHCLLATSIACRTSTALPTRTERSFTRTSTTVMVSCLVLPNKSSSASVVSRCSLCIALFLCFTYAKDVLFVSGFACLFVRWHNNARITRPILHTSGQVPHKWYDEIISHRPRVRVRVS